MLTTDINKVQNLNAATLATKFITNFHTILYILYIIRSLKNNHVRTVIHEI